MPIAKRPLAVIAVVLGAALAGCGSQTQPSIPESSHLVGQSSTSPGQIIISQLGAQRIGIQTAFARPVPAPAPIIKTTVLHGVKTTTTSPATKPPAGVVIPYSAIIYDPSGKTYVFTSASPLTFVEVPVSVEHIAGDSAYLKTGPKAGAKVVTVGAEELYGVQTGVLAQS